MESSKTTPAILIKFTYVVVLVKLVIFLVHNFLIGALLLGVIGVQSSKFNDFHHFSPLNNSVTVCSYWTKLIYRIALSLTNIFLVHNFLIEALLLGVIGVQISKFNDFHHFSPMNNSVTVCWYGTKLTYRLALSLGNIFLVHKFLIGALLLGVIGVQSSKFNDFHHFSPMNNSVTVCWY